MTSRAVLVVGATSSIARALAARFARDGASLHLAARDAAEVERIAKDLAIRYRVPVTSGPFEAGDRDSHAALIESAAEAMGRLDGLVVAFGHLGDQTRAEEDFEHALAIIDANYVGAASVLTVAANHLEQQGHGFIVGIASVAGDRGRQSNYVYGSAKGALDLFLQGLRNRLAGRGVHVLTVKPGFVDTKMTFGKPGLFLVAEPEDVAEDVVKALRRGRNVVYTPGFWRLIMLGIRAVPEPLFKRLSL